MPQGKNSKNQETNFIDIDKGEAHETTENDPMGSQVLRNSQSFLPSLLLTNLRGFGKPGESDKPEYLETVLSLNDVDLTVLTETWATKDTLSDLNFEGYTIFHSIRQNCKRPSGGISILVKKSLQAVRLNINVPSHFEVMYDLVRPKWLPRNISNIVVCGAYYPGSTSKYAPPQEDLIIHLTETLHDFYNKYANPLIMLAGDFNDLKIVDLCESCSLKQVVNVPTRNNAILDLIMTNLDNKWYKDPISLPSISNSDHLCVLYVPKEYVKPETKKEKICIRKFKKSALIAFGAWLVNHDWSPIFEMKDVDKKLHISQQLPGL